MGNALKEFFRGALRKEERVYLDDAELEGRYAVHSDDPEEARRIITSGLCKSMVALADAYDEKSLSAAFIEGVFLMAVPVSGDLFELGSVKCSVYDCEEDVHDFLKEVTIAHRVIDYLHGHRPEETA